jgi:hypothetical protein
MGGSVAKLVLFLTMLVLLGSFADFVVGKAGRKRAKEALAVFYLGINNGSWERIFHFVGRYLSGFSFALLGKPFSLKFVGRTFLISVVMTILMLFSYVTMQAESGWSSPDFREELFLLIGSGVAVNFVCDLVSWTTAAWIFARMATGTKVQSILLSLLVLLQCYVTMVVAYVGSIFGYAFLLSGIARLRGESDVYEGAASYAELLMQSINLAGSFWNQLTYQFAGPDDEFVMMLVRGMYVTSLSTALPHMIFVVAVAGCLIIASSRRIFQRPISLILERAEASDKSVFTLAGLGIGGLVTLITAVQKFLA